MNKTKQAESSLRFTSSSLPGIFNFSLLRLVTYSEASEKSKSDALQLKPPEHHPTFAFNFDTSRYVSSLSFESYAMRLVRFTGSAQAQNSSENHASSTLFLVEQIYIFAVFIILILQFGIDLSWETRKWFCICSKQANERAADSNEVNEWRKKYAKRERRKIKWEIVQKKTQQSGDLR